jgi:hypothetical protein
LDDLTGNNFSVYLVQRIYDIGMKIGPDVVDDIVQETTHADQERSENRSGFNLSGMTVEAGQFNNPEQPALNQLFEIHASSSSRKIMVMNFCGTCWRSPGWSADVMYSTYAVGKANGDEQISISCVSGDDNGGNYDSYDDYGDY